MNGRIVAAEACVVPIESLSVGLGFSVFEAFRVWKSEGGGSAAFRLRDHINRLNRSLKIMRSTMFWDEAAIVTAVAQLMEANGIDGDAYGRLTVFVDRPSPSGAIYAPNAVECKLAIHLKEGAASMPQSTIDVAISSWRRIDENCMPPRVKASANYHNTRLAGFQALADGYDNALLLNQAGKISEAGESAVLMFVKGCACTPPPTAGALESITLDTSLQLLKKAEIPVQVREIDRSELYLADEIVLCNTAKLLRPVKSVDRYSVQNSADRPLTRWLQTEFESAARNVPGCSDAAWHVHVG